MAIPGAPVPPYTFTLHFHVGKGTQSWCTDRDCGWAHGGSFLVLRVTPAILPQVRGICLRCGCAKDYHESMGVLSGCTLCPSCVGFLEVEV